MGPIITAGSCQDPTYAVQQIWSDAVGTPITERPPLVQADGLIPVADYPFSPVSDLPHQWVGNSAEGKSAAERRGRSPGTGW